MKFAHRSGDLGHLLVCVRARIRDPGNEPVKGASFDLKINSDVHC